MDPDLIDLLSAWFGGEATPERREALLGRLRADEAFRGSFVAEVRMLGMLRAAQAPEPRWLRLEDELGWGAADPAADRALEDRVVGRLDAPPASPSAPAVRGVGRRGRRAAVWAAAAAVLGAAALAGYRFWPSPAPVATGLASAAPQPGARPFPRVDAMDGLAMAVRLDGVRWEADGVPHPAEGDVLPAGRLRIAAGRARLSMLTGVVLDVEGPADVELVASEKVVCRRGRLRARVPAGAEGFVVLGPGAAVVDLGTEFGVNVEADGRTRGRIFRGKLEAALLNESGTARSSYFLDADRADATKAFEVDARSGRIGAVAASGDFAAASEPAAPALGLAEGYRTAVLRSRPWGYWRFEAIDDGATPNEVAGRPPLRVVGPIAPAGPTGGNRSAAFGPGAPGQHLTLDEPWPPAGGAGFAVELWTLAEGIAHASLAALVAPAGSDSHRLLLETTARNRLTIHKPASFRLLHRDPPGWEGGDNAYSASPYVPYRWHHVVGQLRDGAAELFVDGTLADRIPAPAAAAGPACQVVLGRLTTKDGTGVSIDRPFVGRMDEVALYDRPLTPDEVREHHRLGAPAR